MTNSLETTATNDQLECWKSIIEDVLKYDLEDYDTMSLSQIYDDQVHHAIQCMDEEVLAKFVSYCRTLIRNQDYALQNRRILSEVFQEKGIFINPEIETVPDLCSPEISVENRIPGSPEDKSYSKRIQEIEDEIRISLGLPTRENTGSSPLLLQSIHGESNFLNATNSKMVLPFEAQQAFRVWVNKQCL